MPKTPSGKKPANSPPDGGYERLENDAYWTPSWVVWALKTSLPPGPYWEPAVGIGRIADVLKIWGQDVRVSDVKDYGYPQTELVDYLKCEQRFEGTIITNPPYVYAEEFVRRSLRLTWLAKGKVVMLLRSDWDAAASRVDLFSKRPFYMKLILTKRPWWTEDKTNSPRHNFAWYIWDWQHEGESIVRYQTNYQMVPLERQRSDQ